MVFLAIFALLCALLFLGFPVGFGLGLAGLVGLILSGQPVAIIAQVLSAASWREGMGQGTWTGHFFGIQQL
jgi:hypothetical protein